MSTINLTGPTTTNGNTPNLTAPTYSFVPGMSTDAYSKVYNVSLLGGTQTGVAIHSTSKNFYVVVKRWKNYLRASAYNLVTGLFGSVPKNKINTHTIKGLNISASQVENGFLKTEFAVPAGAEAYDAPGVDAMFECHIQVLTKLRAELLDGSKTGTI